MNFNLAICADLLYNFKSAQFAFLHILIGFCIFSFIILINCVAERIFFSLVLSDKIFCKYKFLGFVSITRSF